jgi:hypothetical protein
MNLRITKTAICVVSDDMITAMEDKRIPNIALLREPNLVAKRPPGIWKSPMPSKKKPLSWPR